jgi:biopolymer transport protein ExbD
MRTHALPVALALALSGCRCEALRHPDAAPPEPAEAAADVPRASRNDLPPATPALEVSVYNDRYEVDNGPLVETWPRSDRERARQAHLDPAPDWPRVRATVPVQSEGATLLEPELQRALERAQLADRARAQQGALPLAFSIRAAPTVPWIRIVRALYTAGMVGFSEPRFVLRAPDGREVALRMPLPRSSGASADTDARQREERTAALIEEARRVFESQQDEAPLGPDLLRVPAVPPGSRSLPTPAPVRVDLSADRAVRVAIGSAPLVPGCGAVHDAPIDAVSAHAGAIDREALVRCLDAARRAGPPIDGATLSADPDLPYGEVIAVLELLHARYHNLAIAVRP